MYFVFFFLMIRRPPRSTLDRSSAASDVYKRQGTGYWVVTHHLTTNVFYSFHITATGVNPTPIVSPYAVSYTHLRAHETVLDLVCRLLLEKKQYSK